MHARVALNTLQDIRVAAMPYRQRPITLSPTHTLYPPAITTDAGTQPGAHPISERPLSTASSLPIILLSLRLIRASAVRRPVLYTCILHQHRPQNPSCCGNTRVVSRVLGLLLGQTFPWLEFPPAEPGLHFDHQRD